MTCVPPSHYPLVIQVLRGDLVVHAPDFEMTIAEPHVPNSVHQLELLRHRMLRNIEMKLQEMLVLKIEPPSPSRLVSSIEDSLSTKEAAKLLGISHDTLARMADRGEIKCSRSPGGHRRFLRSDLAKVL